MSFGSGDLSPSQGRVGPCGSRLGFGSDNLSRYRYRADLTLVLGFAPLRSHCRFGLRNLLRLLSEYLLLLEVVVLLMPLEVILLVLMLPLPVDMVLLLLAFRSSHSLAR